MAGLHPFASWFCSFNCRKYKRARSPTAVGVMLNSRRTVQSVCTLAPPPLLSCQNVWDRGHHLTSPPQQCCRKGAQWWDLSSDCVVVADNFIMLAECVGLNVLSFILTVLGEEQAKSIASSHVSYDPFLLHSAILDLNNDALVGKRYRTGLERYRLRFVRWDFGWEVSCPHTVSWKNLPSWPVLLLPSWSRLDYH